MKYNLNLGGCLYEQITYRQVVMFIRELIVNRQSAEFSVELKNINVLDGLEKYIKNNKIINQTLNFSCVKGDINFTGLNNIKFNWFNKYNLKDYHVYSPCSFLFINDIFDDKIYNTASIFFILAAESELVEHICTHCTDHAVPAVYDFSIFKHIIDATLKMRYRSKHKLPLTYEVYVDKFKNNSKAQKELFISTNLP